MAFLPPPILMKALRPLVAATSSLLLGCVAFAQSLNLQIKVDQLGYRPDGTKFVIFGDSEEGQAADSSYVPSGQFVLRRASDGVQVWPTSGTATAALLNGGLPVSDAGEIVHRGDFSSFTTPGTYFIHDPVRDVRSPRFSIGNEVYDAAFHHAVRSYYFMRANIALPAQFAGAWHREASQSQQQAAEFYDTAPRGDPKDLTGGWYDAGDYNRYVTFAAPAVWWLLQAVEAHPQAFGDATNIPESGNGRADLLDEVKVCLDWLLKMQETRAGHVNEGGVHNILGTIGGQPSARGNPALDTAPYYYSSVTSWATASAAASYAHGARAFRSVDATYSAKLESAARKAWAWLQANPTMVPATGNDTSKGAVGAGESKGTDGDDLRFRIWAAAELWCLTGEEAFHTYFKEHHDDPLASEGGHHPWLGTSFEHSRCFELFAGYTSYALVNRAGSDASIIEGVKTRLRVAAEYSVDRSDWMAYRFPNEWSHYYWGSNGSRSRAASQLLLAVRLGVNQQAGARYSDAKFREAAEEMLHYLHGRNALGYMYLSNLGPKGANLVEGLTPVEVYHDWFAEGSRYDGVSGTNIGPAPGILVGGPAKYSYDYFGNGYGQVSLTPPAGQPADKSYLDFNTIFIPGTGNPGSYVVNEPGIYYQAPYVYLLSAFVTAAPPPAVPHSVTPTWPTSIPAAESFQVPVAVGGSGTRNLIASLFDSSGQSLGSSAVVAVSEPGTYTLTFTRSTPISGATVAIWIGLFDSAWSSPTLAEAYRAGIAVNQPPPVVGFSGVLAAWDFAGNNGSVSSPADSTATNLTVSHASLGSGLIAVNYNGGGGLTGRGQTATALAGALSGNDYVSFTLTPPTSRSLTVSKIILRPVSQSRRRTFTVFSSVGGFASGAEIRSFTAQANANAALVEIPVTGVTGVSGPIEFRVYIHGQNRQLEAVGLGNGTGNDLVIEGSF